MKDTIPLAPVSRSTDARGGEGPSKIWKLASEFTLRYEDENFGDEVQVLSELLGNDDNENDEEDVEYVTNADIEIPAPKKFIAKVRMEEDERIWSTVSWPSTLSNVLQRSIQTAKAKIKLMVDAFRATPSMLLPIPTLKIASIDEVSPLRTPDDILEDPLQSSPLKFIVDENMMHVISVFNEDKDKGKKPITDEHQALHFRHLSKQKFGWSR